MRKSAKYIVVSSVLITLRVMTLAARTSNLELYARRRCAALQPQFDENDVKVS